MADLLINGNDAYLAYGVRMGEGFLDALGLPPSNKEYIENESRLEDGKRRLLTDLKLASRTLTLSFVIMGATHQQYLQRKAAFLALLTAGEITINVPADGEAYYRLSFDKYTTYAQNRRRTLCTLAAQFTELNPANRSAPASGS